MPVVAVVNRKGGSGKSTLSAHLAAWCAHNGSAVMLGDVDRQQSTRSWLRKRHESLPSIAPWTVDQSILRVPTGITHVVLDTPGGLHGYDLARMVMFADAIIMPVCGSSFDRESAADCLAELNALPRITSGRCKVACIGMRIDVRTRTPQVLKEWADGLGLPFLGVLRETQAYVQCLERGMTLFDLPRERVAVDLKQWEPILQWLAPVLGPVAAAATAPVQSAPGAGHQAVPSRLFAPHAESPAVPQKAVAPAITRNPTPRVLDRVTPAAAAARVAAPRVAARVSGHAPLAAEPQPIPAFLKLVKC